MGENVVVIVGAGPAGLAVSNCLSHLGISNVVLEREDCCASLWKMRAYDRLRLHLGKKFCSLPYMPHPSSTPRFMSKDMFIDYVDLYVKKFGIRPRYGRSVVSATYDKESGNWTVMAKNAGETEMETYVSRFLVVATGENGEGVIPKIDGLESFEGKTVHSSEYKCGREFEGKEVLVVGCGNSGMEIAYDLSNYGANVSIIVRHPFHVLNKEIVYIGMSLANYVPRFIADKIMVLLKRLHYGDLSKYGIHAPKEGPFKIKFGGGATPVIDVGTISKIKSGEIKVCPGVRKVKGDMVLFENGTQKHFDAMVFATGYRSTSNAWLKDHAYLLNEDGMPKGRPPNHWKGENGVYCAGFSKNGLFGISKDALAIANDIHTSMHLGNVGPTRCPLTSAFLPLETFSAPTPPSEQPVGVADRFPPIPLSKQQDVPPLATAPAPPVAPPQPSTEGAKAPETAAVQVETAMKDPGEKEGPKDFA